MLHFVFAQAAFQTPELLKPEHRECLGAFQSPRVFVFKMLNFAFKMMNST